MRICVSLPLVRTEVTMRVYYFFLLTFTSRVYYNSFKDKLQWSVNTYMCNKYMYLRIWYKKKHRSEKMYKEKLWKDDLTEG